MIAKVPCLESRMDRCHGGRRIDRAQAAVDKPRIEAAVREILLAIGEDPDREGLRETPRRVARAYGEMFRGLRDDPATHLGRVFAQEHDEIILLRDIDFASTCEHHLLPFTGKAHIAYLPSSGRVVGLSKLARTVELFAKRPQVQERLTNQIADAIMRHLDPLGVAVVIESEHLCMKLRGVRNAGSTMVTTARRGVFAADPVYREEVMSLIFQSRVSPR